MCVCVWYGICLYITCCRNTSTRAVPNLQSCCARFGSLRLVLVKVSSHPRCMYIYRKCLYLCVYLLKNMDALCIVFSWCVLVSSSRNLPCRQAWTQLWFLLPCVAPSVVHLFLLLACCLSLLSFFLRCPLWVQIGWFSRKRLAPRVQVGKQVCSQVHSVVGLTCLQVHSVVQEYALHVVNLAIPAGCLANTLPQVCLELFHKIQSYALPCFLFLVPPPGTPPLAFGPVCPGEVAEAWEAALGWH